MTGKRQATGKGQGLFFCLMGAFLIVVCVSGVGLLWLTQMALPKHVALTSKKLPSVIQVTTFSNGVEIAHPELRVGSTEYTELSQWIDAHQSGWKIDFTSYSPGILVHGDGFSLNFLGGSVVLNSWSSANKPHGQFVIDGATPFPKFLNSNTNTTH